MVTPLGMEPLGRVQSSLTLPSGLTLYMTALRPPPYTLFSLSTTTPSDYKTPRPKISTESTEYVAIRMPSLFLELSALSRSFCE